MNELSREYFDSRMNAVNEKMDDFISEARKEREENHADKQDLFTRVSANEGDIKVLHQTRPTIPQMLTASFLIASILIGIVQLFLMIL